MAYPVSTGDVVEMSIMALLNQQRILTVRHFIVSTSGGVTDFRAAVNALQTSIDAPGKLLAAWKDVTSQDVVNIQTRWQIIYPVRKPPITAGALTVTTGQRAGTTLPPNVAAFVEAKTDTAGRRGHGGIHVPGMIEGTVINGRWDQDTLDLLSVLGGQLKADVTGGGITMYPVVYSRATPATSPEVVDWEVMGTCRTMRRRTVGLGE